MDRHHGCYVDSSPAIAVDGSVYVGSDVNKLYAITQDCCNATMLWHISHVLPSINRHRYYSRGVLKATRMKLLELNVYATGGKLWMHHTLKRNQTTPESLGQFVRRSSLPMSER